MTQHGDRGWQRTSVSVAINPFITHPAHERLYHTTGVYAPYSLRTAGWDLLRPTRRAVRRGLYGFSSLSEKTRMTLECLTICRCYNKGSTFSSVILRPWVLVQPGLNPRPPAYPIELTGRRLTNLLVTFQTCPNYTFFREQVKCSSVRSGFTVKCNFTRSLEAVEKEIRASAVWRLVEKLLPAKENVHLKKTIFFFKRRQPIRTKNWMFLTAKTETFHLTSKIPNNINRKKRNPPWYSVLTSMCALFFTLFYVSSEFWQVLTPFEPEPAIFSENSCLHLFVWLLKIVFC